MPSITGIELGPDSCVLVRARQRADRVEVSAFHQIERAAWPADDTALASTLRQLRKSRGFPARARVVAWALTEPAERNDPFVRSLVKPIAAAGFRVERVLTPPEALAEIARTRPRGRGVAAAWLAVNVNGAAIAIVRDGTLLFGRTFDWNYSLEAIGPRAELLRRYSLVSHLAPEVRRGITAARTAHGAVVETAITCGDLPDLRSLTMPLIEELDLEVETLDSTEGLVATTRVRSDRFAEYAPAIRLATAAAAIAASKRWAATIKSVMHAAAAIFIVAAIGWFGYRYWTSGPFRPVSDRVADAPRTAPAATTGTAPAGPPQARASVPPPRTPAPVSTSTAVVTTAPSVVAPPVSTIGPPNPSASVTPATKPSAPPPTPLPPSTMPAPQTPTPAPMTTKAVPAATVPAPSASALPKVAAPPPTSRPASSIVSPPAPAPAAPARMDPAPAKPTDAPGVVAGAARGAVDPTTTRADNSRRKPPVPLKAPVPAVQSILVASDRRVAVLDGQIVTVGDQVGPRTVAGIERDAVVLQEPSGYQIRIPIRRGRGVESPE